MVRFRRPIIRLSTAIPIYMQIAEGLLEEIEGGQLTPGTRLPSERDLSSELGVNRMTLRQALRMLEAQGLLDRRQGDGTYVAQPKIEQQLGHWLPIASDGDQPEQGLSARLISFQRIVAETSIARNLQIDVSSPIYQIIRLRLVGEEPLVLERLMVPVQRFPELERFDLTQRLVYQVMEDEFDVKVMAVRQSLEPVIATRFEAELMQVKAGAPLLLERRTAFDEAGIPVEYGKDLYRGDRFRFVIHASLE